MDLVFSDVHADIEALETIIDIATSKEFEEKYGKIDRIINLGDVLERGTHPKQVLQRLISVEKQYPTISVVGNHDEAFLYKKRVSASSLESISAHEALGLDELSFFKTNYDCTFGNQQFLDTKNHLFCVHGGPLDPKKITPKNAGSKSWLYQRSWQRLSEENFEFFSYAGYHYLPSSAFNEVKKSFSNFIILCGHQHLETVLKQDDKVVQEISTSTKTKHEKLSNHHLDAKEFEINPSSNYLVRLGLAGPEGYYGSGTAQPKFGIIQNNPRKVILFTVKK